MSRRATYGVLKSQSEIHCLFSILQMRWVTNEINSSPHSRTGASNFFTTFIFDSFSASNKNRLDHSLNGCLKFSTSYKTSVHLDTSSMDHHQILSHIDTKQIAWVVFASMRSWLQTLSKVAKVKFLSWKWLVASCLFSAFFVMGNILP